MGQTSASAGSMSGVVVDEKRRQQMLAALDIEVWQVRGEQTSTSVGEIDVETAGKPSVQRPTVAAATRSGGPAAAKALLEESQATPGRAGHGNRLSESLANSEIDNSAINSAAPINPEPAVSGPPEPQLPPQPRVNLWCLSGPQGVLLANSKGLSPHAQRLLSDVFQAAMRIVAAVPSADKKAPSKLITQQLRFNWPPADGGTALGAGTSTSRALRGFLSRQLQDKSNAFILYAAPELEALLIESQLSVAPERRLFTGDAEALLADSAAKRALWQTLNTL